MGDNAKIREGGEALNQIRGEADEKGNMWKGGI